jgi:hypothetical protein
MKVFPHRRLLALLFPLCLLAACGASDVNLTPTTLTLEKLGAHDGAVLGAAEITAYDPASKRLFVVNGANGSVNVLDLSSPASP